MFDTIGWIFICIVIMIWSFFIGFVYQLSRLYKMKTGNSVWRIKFRDMERAVIRSD